MKRRRITDEAARIRYAYQLKKRFNISLEDFVRMGKLQGWCCLICKRSREELQQDLVVDHDHATGEVRGLICKAHNQALGLFQDRVDWLLSAVEYLRRMNGTTLLSNNEGAGSTNASSPEHGEDPSGLQLGSEEDTD